MSNYKRKYKRIKPTPRRVLHPEVETPVYADGITLDFSPKKNWLGLYDDIEFLSPKTPRTHQANMSRLVQNLEKILTNHSSTGKLYITGHCPLWVHNLLMLVIGAHWKQSVSFVNETPTMFEYGRLHQ